MALQYVISFCIHSHLKTPPHSPHHGQQRLHIRNGTRYFTVMRGPHYQLVWCARYVGRIDHITARAPP